jgi:hypothetical protein
VILPGVKGMDRAARPFHILNRTAENFGDFLMPWLERHSGRLSRAVILKRHGIHSAERVFRYRFPEGFILFKEVFLGLSRVFSGFLYCFILLYGGIRCLGRVIDILDNGMAEHILIKSLVYADHQAFFYNHIPAG